MKKHLKISSFLIYLLLLNNISAAYTHADTLRGSNGTGRNWWNLTHYDLNVNFDFLNKSIEGVNTISFDITKKPNDSLQLDLQEPMVIDKVLCDSNTLNFVKEGNVWWVMHPFKNRDSGSHLKITVYFHGSPRAAVNPPWDGGFSWTKDEKGTNWIAVSCQGLGASIWWPCKDVQWDEPDSGMSLEFQIPDSSLSVVSNGRCKINGKKNEQTNKYVWRWEVKNPINNYDATFYIGDYAHWHDTMNGENGKLDLDFWVLSYNIDKAKKQFKDVKNMIKCFEYWLGPFPFYEDGYKLVEAPYLGMEHQTAIAYGNKYQMGYLGKDRTNTGIGMQFDYIIVHESGHEWYGNSVTAKDIADNWIQEGITTYSESLITECELGKEKGQKYCHGEWDNIFNSKPIIGTYGVNKEGAPDMYDKGAAIMYMIRCIVNDDDKFRMILRGLSKTFYHQTTTTQHIEKYISRATKMDLSPFFEQYLRTRNIPELEYYIKDGQLNYKFNNVVPEFSLPISITSGTIQTIISPTPTWQHIKWKGGYNVKFSDDFLIKIKE